jgi:hypothetical protein
MMEKLLHFEGSDGGNTFTRLIPHRFALAKLAGADSLSEEVHQFIDRMEPEQGHTYVLNNSLGSFEYYGSNINGDTFPEAGLLNGHEKMASIPSWEVDRRARAAKESRYGYPTFYNAHIFQHHQNKDPSKTLGRIILASWNPRMHRVETIFDLNHDLCERQGAMPLVRKILEGIFPPTSMGCKVPFDRCTQCGNLAKTKADYCCHVNNKDSRYGMNKILDDGSVCAVHNDYPNFFDDSFVIIGADRTATVMAKLAHNQQRYWVFSPQGIAMPSAERGELFYGNTKEAAILDHIPERVLDQEGKASVQRKARALVKNQPELVNLFPNVAKASLAGIVKEAGAREDFREVAVRATEELRNKKAAFKFSEMVKRLPAGGSDKILKRVEDHEPELPSRVLRRLAGAKSLEHGLAGPARAGIVLRPEEFQDVALQHFGMGRQAGEYRRSGTVFKQSKCQCREATDLGMPDDEVKDLIEAVSEFIESRSCASPVLSRRIIMIFRGPAPPRRSLTERSDPVLDRLAEKYASYREGVVRSAGIVRKSMKGEELRKKLRRPDVLDVTARIKQSSLHTASPLEVLAEVAPFVYLKTAYRSTEARRGLINAELHQQNGLVTFGDESDQVTADPADVRAAIQVLV